MRHFTEEQLKELATVFGLTRAETLPVRDGVVSKTCKVWWRGNDGPELVVAGDPTHWENVRNYPSAYQLTKPKMKLTYLEEGV